MLYETLDSMEISGQVGISSAQNGGVSTGTGTGTASLNTYTGEAGATGTGDGVSFGK